MSSPFFGILFGQLRPSLRLKGRPLKLEYSQVRAPLSFQTLAKVVATSRCAGTDRSRRYHPSSTSPFVLHACL